MNITRFCDRGTKIAHRLAIVGACLLAVVPAWATDPTVDYAAAATAVKSELLTTISTVLPVAAVIMAIIMGPFLLKKIVKRFAA